MVKVALSLKNVSVSYHIVNSFKIRRAHVDVNAKSFQRFYALSDVSFDLEEGVILGIIGKNGSGKSTLLKAVAGIFSPDSGSIDLCGSRVSLLSIGVGFDASLSGIDNIYLSGMLLGLRKNDIQKKISEIIEFSELGDFVKKPVGTYSK